MSLRTLDFPQVRRILTVEVKAEVVTMHKLQEGDVVCLLGQLVIIARITPVGKAHPPASYILKVKLAL